MNTEGNNEANYTYKDVRHIVRLAIILVGGFSLSIALRYAAVPKSYYEKGRYRAAAPEKIASSNSRFAGMEACVECHEDKRDALLKSKHHTLHCETCHWASADHAADPDIEPRRKVKSAGMREFCATCHARQTGKPAWFPQIDLAEHNPGESCAECHNPHSPEMN